MRRGTTCSSEWSAANMLVSGTTAHLQRSLGVQVSSGQDCSSSTLKREETSYYLAGCQVIGSQANCYNLDFSYVLFCEQVIKNIDTE